MYSFSSEPALIPCTEKESTTGVLPTSFGQPVPLKLWASDAPPTEKNWESILSARGRTPPPTSRDQVAIVDERGEGHRAEFRYEGGIVDFVAYLNENKDTVHRKVIFFAGESEEGAAEVSHVSPYVIGGFAFVALAVLLVVTMMIKVGD